MRVGVVGLGTMGAGIAQVCVEAGLEVVACDVDADRCAAGHAAVARGLDRRVAGGHMTADERDTALARLRTAVGVADLSGSEAVIEAVVEDIDAKRAVVVELDRVLGESALVATNTSALPVTAIAAASAHPERVVGLHFFNPAPVLPLVEVVRTALTSDDAYRRALELVERLGKDAVPCGDTPGFVVNRLLIPLLNDAVRVLDETGVAPEDVDRAMRLGTNWPIGPLALVDLIGVDVHVHAADALWEALREPRFAPPPRLRRMVEAGHLGRKAGRGFYDHAAAG